MAETREKIIAPLPNPEPFLRANNQKVFAIRYARREAPASHQPPFIDQFFASTSAINSKKIKIASGISH